MRPESDSFDKEDKRGRSESETPVVSNDGSWVIYEEPPEEESKKKLTQELFGDALAKIEQLFMLDKKKFERLIKGKKHGN